jgi:hypothetical protein
MCRVERCLASFGRRHKEGQIVVVYRVAARKGEDRGLIVEHVHLEVGIVIWVSRVGGD